MPREITKAFSKERVDSNICKTTKHNLEILTKQIDTLKPVFKNTFSNTI